MHRCPGPLVLVPALLLASSLWSPPASVQAGSPVVRAVLFYSETRPRYQTLLKREC